MPLPPCGQHIVVCEICGARAQPLNQLSVRMPGGKLVVATLCDVCHMRLVPRLVVMVQP